MYALAEQRMHTLAEVAGQCPTAVVLGLHVCLYAVHWDKRCRL